MPQRKPENFRNVHAPKEHTDALYRCTVCAKIYRVIADFIGAVNLSFRAGDRQHPCLASMGEGGRSAGRLRPLRKGRCACAQWKVGHLVDAESPLSLPGGAEGEARDAWVGLHHRCYQVNWLDAEMPEELDALIERRGRALWSPLRRDPLAERSSLTR